MIRPEDKRENTDKENDRREFLSRAIDEHRNIIFSYIMTQVANLDTAEEVFQEVCTTLCEKIDSFRKGSNFKAWVMQITRFKILSAYQDRTKDRRMTQLTPELAEELGDNELWTSDQEDPFTDEREALRQCLEELSEIHRDIIIGRYGQKWSAEELAKRFKRTAASIYVILSRLRASLEQCIRRHISEVAP